jgi:RNA polymerase sigma-70 factor (ECF subfamily)
MRRPGPYQLQAAIAAVHDEAPTADSTDWAQIAGLYGALAERAPSPVVELNRAVAVAMVDGPDRGLAIVERLAADGELDDYQFLHGARADLLRRLGRTTRAATATDAPWPSRRTPRSEHSWKVVSRRSRSRL